MTLPVVVFFFFKQKTAYEMRISDWISDVCSSDLSAIHLGRNGLDLFPQRSVFLVHELEVRGLLLDDIDNSFGDVHRALAAFSPVTCEYNRHVVVKIGRASCRERVCQYV